MKRLSVIIVSYHNIDVLKNCLDSIEKYNDIGDELEVIVSDNSTDDCLFETIKEEYDWIKIIKNENKGFGAGNNRGYEISSGEYLLFLNPDTILVEPVFRFAINEFEKDEDLALFGVNLTGITGKKNIAYLYMDNYSLFYNLKIKLCRAFNIFIDGKMFINGANLFLRRKSFEEAGRFDENIFMYKEEEDLTKRIKLYSQAKKIKYFKEKKIIHLEGGTQNGNTQSESQLTRMYESDVYYSGKWNRSVIKLYKQKKNYQIFKLIVCKILFKRALVDNIKRVIRFYDQKISELKKLRQS